MKQRQYLWHCYRSRFLRLLEHLNTALIMGFIRKTNSLINKLTFQKPNGILSGKNCSGLSIYYFWMWKKCCFFEIKLTFVMLITLFFVSIWKCKRLPDFLYLKITYKICHYFNNSLCKKYNHSSQQYIYTLITSSYILWFHKA